VIRTGVVLPLFRQTPDGALAAAHAAFAAGVDGVFMEVHDNHAQAKSDGANALDLKFLPEMLDQVIAVHSALK